MEVPPVVGFSHFMGRAVRGAKYVNGEQTVYFMDGTTAVIERAVFARPQNGGPRGMDYSEFESVMRTAIRYKHKNGGFVLALPALSFMRGVIDPARIGTADALVKVRLPGKYALDAEGKPKLVGEGGSLVARKSEYVVARVNAEGEAPEFFAVSSEQFVAEYSAVVTR